ncbi:MULTISPECIES: phosphoribosylanthranilate isomerase [unclassified Kaistella]|uniref:phosphoribosylanthranilate isomerase n=1 Tax=unclassified Kaistella TaxID=2762626 RepID=UPI0027373C09|nr:MULTISPECIES: phosphoribosylanthranilate isomerase [unclassified Kaistella]MDP2454092.1 phosphoribosylanthranilate isomerase [Kaistella sp. SH11-4b]MDP2457149.1 phosphoribosylanthranilate isomerase [Kaistella sp. SH40-3]MDP2459907.1 phosphoribosylanthranilate isomerase [Kaistella sp. SH19-2b]
MDSNLKLKVCGLAKLDQIEELVSLKTDFLGFIFYKKSPRYVLDSLTLEEIKAIKHSGKVGVFVNESAEKIREISEKANLNFIQLHGDENDDFITELKIELDPEIKIIKVFRIGTDLGNLKFKIQNLKSEVDYFLFDTDSKSFGGTGNSFDWQILNDLEINKPYFLSGGISEDNIINIKLLKQKPFALDINSKFELEPGNKDIGKILKFKNALSRKVTR